MYNGFHVEEIQAIRGQHITPAFPTENTVLNKMLIHVIYHALSHILKTVLQLIQDKYGTFLSCAIEENGHNI